MKGERETNPHLCDAAALFPPKISVVAYFAKALSSLYVIYGRTLYERLSVTFKGASGKLNANPQTNHLPFEHNPMSLLPYSLYSLQKANDCLIICSLFSRVFGLCLTCVVEYRPDSP